MSSPLTQFHDQLGEIRLLHVDDEPGFADMVATFLHREDNRFTVETVTSVSEGLDRLNEKQFDCIISDYDMPGQTGIEFLEAVREDDSDLPFILYTGQGSEEVASDAIMAGVTDYLQKQPGSDQYKLLANRVANAVEQYRARQAMEDARRRFRTLVEEATDAIIIVEPDGTIAYATPAAESILGRPPEELVGTNGFDPIHPGDREHVMAEFGSLVDNPDDRRTVEFRYQQPDGSYIWAEARGRNLLDEPLIDGIVVYTRDITDRKERELELQRQERRYQAIFNDPNILVGLIDTDGTVLDINQKAMEYIDLTLDDVVGKLFWETPWFDHSEAVKEEVKQWIDRAAENEYVEFETELIRPNGDPYTVAGVFRPVTNDDGEVVSLIISDRDITAQKAYEQELETVQRRFEAVLENTTTPMFMKDDEGAYIFVNQGYRDLFGLEDEDIVGRTDSELHPPEVADQVRENDQLVLDRGEAVETEEHVMVDGTERIFLSTKVPIYDTGDRSDPEHPIAVFGVASDITELKEREQKRETTIEFLQSLYDVATDRTLDVNDKITRLLELGPEQLDLPSGYLTRIEVNDEVREEGTQRVIEASGDHELLQPGDVCPLVQSYCRKTIETDEVVTIQDALAAGWDGDPAYELFNLGCYIGTKITVNDDLYGTVFFAAESPRDEPFTDAEQAFVRLMSQLVSYEIERDHARQELKQQNARLEEFVSVVSHDLQNPLNVAEGRLALGREECDNEHFEQVARAHERMNILIDDLLTLAREGEETVDPEPIPLAKYSEACWETVETADATLVIDSDRTLTADRSKLQQLLENLYRNAVEHGGEDVTVTVGDLDTGFYIEDDGPGIPETERDEVFDAGYSTKNDGTGFGMSIVKRIVEAHGWEIDVTESSAGGARFEITGVTFATE